MSSDLTVMLQRLAADRSKLGTLTADQSCALRELLEAALGNDVPIASAPAPTSVPQPGSAWGPDDLLTPEEAAAALRVSRRWLYRHAKQLPFARKLSPKVLRFSRSGMARWMATKRP